MKKPSDLTFAELWDIAYLHYLRMRASYGIPLTAEQKRLLSR